MNFVRHNTGTILLTVIILTMILSVIAISVMSISTSQVRSSQSIIEDIKAVYLTEGYFYKYNQDILTSGTVLEEIPSVELDSKTFSFTATNSIGGPNDTSKITIQASF